MMNNFIPDILSKSTLSLIPSQDLEGTSLSALEAMASGVVCISTTVGGLRDLPTYKSSTVRPNDIASAMFSACKDYETIRSYQMNECFKNYDLQKWKHNIMCVFEKLD
jgi:glycosyltransferase involved in cell wall biosynthesis